MALLIFLRGVNVGGHRTFRPSLLAQKLCDYDVVNIGAAGTFVVRKPGSRTAFLDLLRRELPVTTHIVSCNAIGFEAAMKRNPFGSRSVPEGITRFVSILERAGGDGPAFPIHLPSQHSWLVRIVAQDGRFVFGEYRRHMKTIGQLGQIDKLFDTRATTRNWTTVQAILSALEKPASRGR